MTGQLDLLKSKRQRGLKPPAVPEFKIHAMVADTLTRWSMPGWWWSHLPSGEKREPITGARLKRMGLKPGLPDFMLISPEGEVMFLELKSEKGNQSEAQEQFFEMAIKRGIRCAIAHSYEEALCILKSWDAVKASIVG